MKLWLGAIVVFLGLLAMAAGILAWYDGERIRLQLQQTLADDHGIALKIEELHRTFEFRPEVRIRGVEVSNARRSSETLIKVQEARFRVHLFSLLIGPLTLDEIVVDGAHVAIPVDGRGVRYWEPVVSAISTFLRRFDWSLRKFEVANLTLDRSHVEYGNDLLVSAELVAGEMPELADLTLTARGVNANLATTLPFRLEGNAQLDLLQLGRADGEMPMSLTATGRIADKVLTVDARGGNLLAGDPLERDAVEGLITVGTRSARVLGTMSRDDDTHLDVALTVNLPGRQGNLPVNGSMRVSDPGHGWQFADIRIERDAGSLTGDLQIDSQDDRENLRADLRFDNVHYPFGPTGDREASNGEKEDAPADGLYGRLLDFIERFDATVAIFAQNSSLHGAPLDSVATLATINKGTFEFRVDRAQLLKGALRGTLTVIQNGDEKLLTLLATLHEADLASLTSGLPSLDGSAGTFEGNLDVKSTGRDIAAVVGDMNGSASMYMQNGKIPDELSRWMAGNIFTALFAKIEGQGKTPVDCAVIEFSIESGIARSQRMLLDTGSFTLVGEGRIDFPGRRVAIELAPYSKQFSLLSMRLPLSIEGPFNDIRIDPDASEAFASLLTPVDTGGGASVACTAPDARSPAD